MDIIAPDQRVERTFYDKNGNPVRYLSAGKGNQLVFTNSTTGFTFTVETGGSVEQRTPNPDGTETWVTTGHELLILFPTDTPPGPVGRLMDHPDMPFLGKTFGQ